ncbi:hypothetical protein CCACVL1_12268 [Corchorus capsularis]|uniref:F-box domain-containing protein n=1 Tax=Corchorus capsularis TaxID=210143 RepID=A0A1R3IGT1_COCAP|nr:hypothetical protein CCACVL1_12268 [Corchorus capsularis]
MSSLPQHMIIDILCCCDPQDLWRFRCLSKECCSLIDSPYFINLHLSHSLKIKPARQMVISREWTSLRCVSLRSRVFKFEPFHEYSEVCEKPNNRTDYRIPFHNAYKTGDSLPRRGKTEFLGSEILGSCNGLIALLCKDTKKDDDEKMFKICVMNPSTRVSRYLPMEIPYDKDYKLVQVSKAKNETIPKTKVYSLNSDSWKSIDHGEVPIQYPLHWPFQKRHLPYCRGRWNGVHVNHALHWLLVNKNENHDLDWWLVNNAVIAFDLTTEEYRQLSLPPRQPSPRGMSSSARDLCEQVYELGGCLCVNYAEEKRYSIDINIWVMKEYGSRESWTKILRVNDDMDDEIQSRGLAYTYSKSGEKLLLMTQYNNSDWCNYLVDVDDKLFRPKKRKEEKLMLESLRRWKCVYALLLLSLHIKLELLQD